MNLVIYESGGKGKLYISSNFNLFSNNQRSFFFKQKFGVKGHTGNLNVYLLRFF